MLDRNVQRSSCQMEDFCLFAVLLVPWLFEFLLCNGLVCRFPRIVENRSSFNLACLDDGLIGTVILLVSSCFRRSNRDHGAERVDTYNIV